MSNIDIKGIVTEVTLKGDDGYNSKEIKAERRGDKIALYIGTSAIYVQREDFTEFVSMVEKMVKG